MLVSPESLSAVLVMTSSQSVPMCNRFRARLVDSGKITFYKYSFLMLLFGGNLFTERHKIFVPKN